MTAFLASFNSHANVSTGFIADDPPIREDVLGSGLSRVNHRLVVAAGDVVGVLACGSRGVYGRRDLPRSISRRSLVWGENTLARRVTNRISPRRFDNEAAFEERWPEILASFRLARVTSLVCTVGVSPVALGRAVRLSQALGVPLSAYLVDDFVDGAVLANREEPALADVPRWLSAVDRLFVISSGLQQRVSEIYGREAAVLPLPHAALSAAEPRSTPLKRQIIFVGNLSHFYIDGLRDLAQALATLAKQLPPITLRLTTPSAEAVAALREIHPHIECGPLQSPEALDAELAASLAAFAPYAFDDRYATMVGTSFPSKLLDYLRAARCILNYAPSSSTSSKYFAEHGLAVRIATQGRAALVDAVESLCAQPVDLSERYREILRIEHAPERIAGQLFNVPDGSAA